MSNPQESKYTREQIFAKVEKLMALANDPAANEHIAASSAALMIVETRPQEAEKHALTVFPNLRPGKVSRMTLFQEAQHLGRLAGKTVPINPGLTDSQHGQNKLRG